MNLNDQLLIQRLNDWKLRKSNREKLPYLGHWSGGLISESGALGNDADGQKGNDLDEQWSKAFETFFAEEGEDGGGAGPGGEKTSDSKGRRRADSQAQVSMFQMVVAVNSAHAAAEKTTKFTHYAKTKFLSIFPHLSYSTHRFSTPH